MKITCIGGGPASLYAAILMAKADPSHEITVIERNPRGSTFGWGVVLSDETLRNMRTADAKSAELITDTLAHWDDIDVYIKNKVIRSSGHGFCGIGRQKLLDILEARAEELGIALRFGETVSDPAAFPDSDLIIAADGVGSAIRTKYAEHFKPDIQKRHCRFTWLGTKQMFPAFTFIFEETEFGWFQAHCYRFDGDTSTFIVECPEEVWQKAGLDKKEKEEAIHFCEKLFAKYLGGHKLLSNSAHLRGSSAWLNFQRVNNEKWHYKNIVLLGDASATAHFSIGSGTKLAVESAIKLSEVVNRAWIEGTPLPDALDEYESARRVEVLKLQSAARNSCEWFEMVKLRTHLEPEQFAYSLLTRSQRVSHENLRLRDRKYLENYEAWLASRETNGKVTTPVPPMFLPMQLRAMELHNRIVVSPMAMYSSVDGNVGDFHLVHLGERAMGGASLVYTEMTCVSLDARITPGCAGMYSDENEKSWKRIVDFIHKETPAKVALQLGHAGPKGSTRVGWEGYDEPLEKGNWPIYAPSALPYGPQNQVPIEMTRTDMDRVIRDFVDAAKRGARAGFDLFELHCAHGYLLSSFISPLTNKRKDAYGGDLANRMRFPLEVFDAIRAELPDEKPMAVRISATDWAAGGTTVDDAIAVSQLFHEHGADLIDVSAGQVVRAQKPVYGRMFQTPFSDRIRSELKIKTMAVGNIFEPDHANSIIAAGRADLCLLGRPHLADPHWTLRAAAELGYEDVKWPKQYISAKRQIETNIKRQKAAMGEI